jgi:hypothetical protein
MPLRKDSPNRSETFGRLLSGAINSIATYEGRTAPVVEEELGVYSISQARPSSATRLATCRRRTARSKS